MSALHTQIHHLIQLFKMEFFYFILMWWSLYITLLACSKVLVENIHSILSSS